MTMYPQLLYGLFTGAVNDRTSPFELREEVLWVATAARLKHNVVRGQAPRIGDIGDIEITS